MLVFVCLWRSWEFRSVYVSSASGFLSLFSQPKKLGIIKMSDQDFCRGGRHNHNGLFYEAKML